MMGQTCLLTTLLVALCASVCPVRGGPLGYCNDQSWTYTQEVLARTDSDIWDIAVSRHTGNVYGAQHLINTLLVINNKNATQNVNIQYISSVAVDNTVPQVYVGSTVNALYIYDEVSGSVTEVTQVQHGVLQLFVPNHRQELYIVSADNEVYRYRHNFTEETKIIDKVGRFIVDDDNNYFYTGEENNEIVTKVQLNGHSDTITFDGPFGVQPVDNVGRVFGARKDRTVHLLKTDGTTQVIARLDFVPRRMSFDADNNAVFGSGDKKIIKLKFNKCISPSTTESSDTTITSQDINTLDRYNNNVLQNVKRELGTRITTADKTVNKTSTFGTFFANSLYIFNIYK